MNKKHVPTPPKTPHKKLLFDYKDMLTIVQSATTKLADGHVNTMNYKDVRATINTALQARAAIKSACDDYLMEHPDEDAEILSELIGNHSKRLKGLQGKLRESATELERLRKAEKNKDDIIQKLQSQIASLKNAMGKS